MDEPGKVANPAPGQLNREINIPLSPCVPENLVSRDGFNRPVPRQPAHLHTQAESGAYLRDSSRVPRRRPFMKPPCAIGSVPSLSDHAIAYRWRSLPRVRRYRASKPQGSSERVLPWEITMDQLIFASLSHTHISQRSTKVNGSHHGDNLLLRPTGIQNAIKFLPGPTNREHRKLIGVETMSLGTNCSFYCLIIKSNSKSIYSYRRVTRRQVMRHFTSNGIDQCQNGL